MQYEIDSSSLVEGTSTIEWLSAEADKRCEWLVEHTAWTQQFLLFSLFLVTASLVVAWPDFRRLLPFSGHAWATTALDWKIHHPLEKIPESLFAGAGPRDAGIVEHLRKCTYRITLPLIAHVLGLGIKGATVIDFVASALFIPVLALNFKKTVRDPVALFLISLSVACSFIGQWGMNDAGNFDGFAFLLLGLAALARGPVLICLLVLAGGFVDERVMVAVPLLLLYQSAVRPEEMNWSSMWRLTRQQRGTMIALGFFCLLRAIVAHHVRRSFDLSGVGFSVIRTNLLFLTLAVLVVFKGSFVLVGAGILSFFKRRASLTAMLVLAGFLLCATASLMVYDLSRSLAYSFPALFICLKCLAETNDVRALRRLSLFAAVISVTMPTYYVLLRVYVLLPILRLL